MDVITVDADASEPKTRLEPQKWLLCPQRAAEIKQLCQPHGARHLLYASPYIALYVAGVALQFYVTSTWAHVLLSVLIANQLYLLFILHHDCMHGIAFRDDFYNRLAGRMYALTFTMTFTVNRETHMRHHSHIADPARDPDEYYFAGELSQIWFRLWRYYEWYTVIALTRYGKRVRKTVLIEQGLNLLLWVAVHALLIHWGMAFQLIYIFWLPMAIVVFVINPITRGYEHSPITLYPPGDPRKRDMTKNTITIANPWLGWLWGNITYHVEHHAYPRCPFYNLQRLHRIFQEEKLQYLVAPYPLFRVWKGPDMIRGMTSNADGGIIAP